MQQRFIHSAIVTGATGAVGMALCNRLLKAGIDVFAVVRPDSERASALPQHKRLHRVDCDASEFHALPERMKGICADAFFSLAWANTFGAGRNNMSSQVDNIRYTIDAVRAAHALGCRVFVGTGSQAEYGRVEGILKADTPAFPENGYGMAKLCAGQMSRVECEMLGMDHVWVRILSVYGPHDGAHSMISSTIRKLLNGEKPALTAGEQMWDYLYSEDSAEALYRCALMGHSGKIYPLGSGHAVPLRQYIEVLRDAIDSSLPLGFGEIPYSPLQVMHLQADIRELTEDTGFEPETSFDEGIRNTIDWIKGEIHAQR